MQAKAKIVYVNPSKIKVPDVRITSDFDPEIEEMFGEDIEKVGIEQPILVGKEGENLWLIDGLHRLQQAKLQDIKEVPCVIREMNIVDSQMRNLMSNRLRGKTKVSEEIKVLKDLFKTHKISIEELVTKSGMRRERVEQLLKVSAVHPDILKGLEDERISLCAAYELSNLPDEDSQLRMLAIIEQYNLKCSDVKDAVIETIRIIAEKEGATIPQNIPLPTEDPRVECQFCKEKVNIKDASSPIMCRYCYGMVIGLILQAKKEMSEEQKIENKKIEDSTEEGVNVKGEG